MISPITTIFGFFAALSLGIPFWAWVVGFLCIGGGNALLFGLFLCIAMDAPVSVYIIGFICAVVDVIITATLNEN